jgi:hypothetical protein
MTANNTLYSNALEAVHSLGLEAAALHRDNVKLAEGVAAQVKIIRELRDEVSRLQADLDIQSYNVEFLKVQARRTRLKLRSAKRGRKQAYDSIRVAQASVNNATSTINGVTAENDKLRMENRQLNTVVTNRNLEIASLKGAIERVQTGNQLPLTMVTEPFPFRVRKFQTPFGIQSMTQLNIEQAATAIMIAPEHRRDVAMHAEVAQVAAKKMAVAIEQAILDALRGEPTDPNEVRRQTYESRMKQQRQMYGADGVIAGKRADLIIADDIGPAPTSKCNCALCRGEAPTDF